MNITLGQYIPIDSPLSRLDPRVKILSLVFFSVLLFLFDGAFPAAVYGVFLCVLAKVSRVPLLSLLSALKPLLWLIVFTMLFHLFSTPGKVLWDMGPLALTYEGIVKSVFLSLRLVYLLLFSALLTFTTSPLMLTDALESLLSPFKKFGLPAHELAMMMTIALRFLPTLMEELERIMKAQKSRGVDFSKGNLPQRMKKLAPILVPLFLSAFRRADELAMAMEARCYKGDEGRSHYRELKITSQDYRAIACEFGIFFLLLGGSLL